MQLIHPAFFSETPPLLLHASPARPRLCSSFLVVDRTRSGGRFPHAVGGDAVASEDARVTVCSAFGYRTSTPNAWRTVTTGEHARAPPPPHARTHTHKQVPGVWRGSREVCINKGFNAKKKRKEKKCPPPPEHLFAKTKFRVLLVYLNFDFAKTM